MPDHQGVSTLSTRLKKAITEGNLTAAEKLQQVVAANPLNKKATEQLKQISPARSPSRITLATVPQTGPDTPTPDEPTKPSPT